ncbi:MAG: hypothetical protein IJ710_05890 [Prevotella sp.]|nr:hypothetical protein [Prevotella sp.]
MNRRLQWLCIVSIALLSAGCVGGRRMAASSGEELALVPEVSLHRDSFQNGDVVVCRKSMEYAVPVDGGQLTIKADQFDLPELPEYARLQCFIYENGREYELGEGPMVKDSYSGFFCCECFPSRSAYPEAKSFGGWYRFRYDAGTHSFVLGFSPNVSGRPRTVCLQYAVFPPKYVGHSPYNLEVVLRQKGT